MATDRVPSQESLIKVMADIPDEAIDIVCLRIQTIDGNISHWHYMRDGEWSRAIG